MRSCGRDANYEAATASLRHAACASICPHLLRVFSCLPACPVVPTWAAVSPYLGGRHPLGKDVQLDYEEMSDQDWEEEPEGESLSVSADERRRHSAAAAKPSTARHSGPASVAHCPAALNSAWAPA